MGNRTVSVKIYAPTLSLLLYENINSKYEQEGFLLGNTNTTIVKSVTDVTREELKVKEEIIITEILPCDIPKSFYHSSGELKRDELNEILGNQKKKVVAWFKYKNFRKHGFKFSIQERVLHEELTKYFNINPYLFNCCLLTKSQSLNKSTLIFTQAFINMYENNLKVVPMHIKNLGDSCHIYQPNIKPSETFMKLYDKVKKDQSDFQIGKDILDSMKKDFKKSINLLESSESKLCGLRKEVDDLKKKIYKSVLESNQFHSSEIITNEPPSDLNELVIDIPLSSNTQSKASPDAQDIKNELNSSTAVVDLTFDEDDDEELNRTRRPRDRRK